MSKTLFKGIDIIANDLSLRVYGLALALTHLWTFFYWNSHSFFINSQSGANAEPVCFPFFPNCDLFRQSISSDSWALILYFYLFMSLLGVVFFASKKTAHLAYWVLLLTTLIKFGLQMSNYNFMGNYHYMIYWIIFAFLFFPYKKIIIKHLLVFFYVAAGFLKINIDWLSGAAMIRSPLITGNLLTLSLFYVVVLELILVFGLLHRNQWVRRFTILQLLGFHAFSWHIVGFFYPLVMFSLLSIFLIDECNKRHSADTKNDLEQFFRFKAPKFLYGFLVFFLALQALPFLFVSDPSLSGAARLTSLNMFDSKTHCHSLLIAKTDQGVVHLRPPIKNLGTRLKCDPIVFLNQAHQLCRLNSEFNELKQLSLHLFSTRVSGKKFKQILNIKDVCKTKNLLWAEFFQGTDS